MEKDGTTNMERVPTPGSHHVALLIDWENVKWSTTKELGAPPDIITLKKIARRFGNISLARAYANWADSYHDGDMERLAQQGIEPIYVLTKHYQGEQAGQPVKNSADLRLTCDGMELLVRNPELSCYVIASGDGGYAHVVNRLRAHGKQVVMVGIDGTVNTVLRTVCDTVVLYDEWIKGLQVSVKSHKVREALTGFQRAVEDLRQTRTDHTLTAVKAQMRTRQTEFEEEALGIASFRHLAFVAESQGLVRIDAEVEPTEAYQKDEMRTEAGGALHGGPKWGQLVTALEPGTMYTRKGLVDVIRDKGIYQEDKDAQALADSACRSGVLWTTSTRFFDPKSQGTQGGRRYLLNQHNPRVQVWLSGKRANPTGTSGTSGKVPFLIKRPRVQGQREGESARSGQVRSGGLRREQ